MRNTAHKTIVHITRFTSLESKLPPVTIPLVMVCSQALNAEPPLQPVCSPPPPHDIRFWADKCLVKFPSVFMHNLSVKLDATATAWNVNNELYYRIVWIIILHNIVNRPHIGLVRLFHRWKITFTNTKHALDQRFLNRVPRNSGVHRCKKDIYSSMPL